MIFYTITTTGVTLGIFIEYFIYAVVILSAFAFIGFFFIIFKKDPITELPPLFLLNTETWVCFVYLLMVQQGWV